MDMAHLILPGIARILLSAGVGVHFIVLQTTSVEMSGTGLTQCLSIESLTYFCRVNLKCPNIKTKIDKSRTHFSRE